MFGIHEFVSYFLATFFVMIGLYFTFRSYAMSEREGYSFISYGRAFSKTWWHRHIFNVFRASILGICVARLFVNVDDYLGIFSSFAGSVITLFGVAFMLLGYSIVSYVSGYMNRDWYSGVAPDIHEQCLVVDGPFSKSRNPLFIGVLFGQLGFFLALPSLFSLVCLVVGAWVIRRQAHVEEDALMQRFGAEYEQYRLQTPRWLPWVSMLRKQAILEPNS